MRLIAVGRIKDGPERQLLERYRQRLMPPLALVEVAEGRGTVSEIKRREAQSLLQALPPQALAVALDEGGWQPSSLELSRRIEAWLGGGRPLCFLVGGAEGLDASVMSRADAGLSLGTLTWPHMLVRGLLAEQLYRAQAIRTGHPYHRSGRP